MPSKLRKASSCCCAVLVGLKRAVSCFGGHIIHPSCFCRGRIQLYRVDRHCGQMDIACFQWRAARFRQEGTIGLCLGHEIIDANIGNEAGGVLFCFEAQQNIGRAEIDGKELVDQIGILRPFKGGFTCCDALFGQGIYHREPFLYGQFGSHRRQGVVMTGHAVDFISVYEDVAAFFQQRETF